MFETIPDRLRHRRIPLAFLVPLCIALGPVGSLAQDGYDFSMKTGYDGSGALKPRDGVITVRIKDLNLLCYDHTFTVTRVQDKDPAILWSQKAFPKAGVKSFGEAEKPTGTRDFIPEGPEGPIDSLSRTQYLEGLESGLKTLVSNQDWMAGELETRRAVRCAREWAEADSLRVKNLGSLFGVMFPSTNASLSALRKLAQAIEPEGDAERNRLAAAKLVLQRAEAKQRELLASYSELLGSYEEAVERIRVPVDRNTSRVEIKIEGKGNEEIPAVKGKTFERTVVFPVHRTFVFRQGIGFLVSTLETPDFKRTRRPGEAGAMGADSTISTFLDRREGDDTTIAPLYTLSALSTRWSSWSMGPTVGFAVRAIDQDTVFDWLLGGSVGVADLLFVTIAWHRGQVEKLLVGEPGEPIPTSITETEAVGKSWRSGIALGVTVTLP